VGEDPTTTVSRRGVLAAAGLGIAGAVALGAGLTAGAGPADASVTTQPFRSMQHPDRLAEVTIGAFAPVGLGKFSL
jgi:hypothetical protein